MAMDTREVIDRYYELVNKGDWDTWCDLFTDDVVMDEQITGRAEGIETLRGAIDGLRTGYSKFHMEPVHILTEGDKGAVVWHCEAITAAGYPIDARGANYFEVRDGKIGYFSNHHDKAAFEPDTTQKAGS